MKALLYLITAVAFVSQFRDLASMLGPVSRLVRILPDLGSGLLLVAILFSFANTKRLVVSPKYVIVGAILLLHMILGAISNSVPPGAFVGGLRAYFAFVPLFLLPAVYEFSEEELKNYFKFVLLLCLVQVPISVYQRAFIFPVTPTGDVVRGMFPSGAIMSTFLIGGIAVLLAMLLRGRLSKLSFFALTTTLTIPMWINETKGTVVLFPIAIFAVAMFFSDPARRVRVFVLSLGVSIVFVVAFAVAYDYFFPKEGSRNALVEFFSEDALNNVYKDQERPKIGAVGRLDSVLYAYKELSDDFTKVAFGLGIGNVSDPETFEVIKGDYGDHYEQYGASTTTYASLLWQTGVLGILLTWLMLWLILNDARRVAQEPGWSGAMGLGWTGVVSMLPVAFLYKDFIYSNSVIVVAMFVTGLIASKSVLISARRNAFSAGKASLLGST